MRRLPWPYSDDMKLAEMQPRLLGYINPDGTERTLHLKVTMSIWQQNVFSLWDWIFVHDVVVRMCSRLGRSDTTQGTSSNLHRIKLQERCPAEKDRPSCHKSFLLPLADPIMHLSTRRPHPWETSTVSPLASEGRCKLQLNSLTSINHQSCVDVNKY